MVPRSFPIISEVSEIQIISPKQKIQSLTQNLRPVFTNLMDKSSNSPAMMVQPSYNLESGCPGEFSLQVRRSWAPGHGSAQPQPPGSARLTEAETPLPDSKYRYAPEP